MTIQEVKEFVTKKFNIDDLYKKARENLAKRIKEDDDFLDDYMNIVEKFKNPNEMIENLSKDAVDADLTKEELETYPDVWLSYILRV